MHHRWPSSSPPHHPASSRPSSGGPVKICPYAADAANCFLPADHCSDRDLPPLQYLLCRRTCHRAMGVIGADPPLADGLGNGGCAALQRHPDPRALLGPLLGQTMRRPRRAMDDRRACLRQLGLPAEARPVPRRRHSSLQQNRSQSSLGRGPRSSGAVPMGLLRATSRWATAEDGPATGRGSTHRLSPFKWRDGSFR